MPRGNLVNMWILKNNARDTNYFTNCWCGDEWLLVNKKMILIVDLDEN